VYKKIYIKFFNFRNIKNKKITISVIAFAFLFFALPMLNVEAAYRTKIWDFSISGDYTYSSSDILILDGKAELKSIPLVITDDTQIEFDAGSYADSIFDTDHIELDNAEITSTANTLALYHLNETTANAVDSSVNSNNAVNNGANQNVAGVYSNGIEFDGVNDYLDITADLGDPTEMTIEFWFKKPNINSGADYLLDARNNGNWWFLQDYSTGTNCSDTNGNICFNGLVEIPSTLLSNNTWYHVALTANTTETKIYLDGNLIDTGAAFNPDLGANVYIGTRFSVTGHFQGAMDEIAIWDTTLNQASISEHARKYKLSGEYISNIFHASQNVPWTTISWSEIEPALTDIQFQVRSCNDAVCDTEIFVGPDGTVNTYFTNSVGYNTNVDTNQYFQYKAYLSSTDPDQTPELDSVVINSDYYLTSHPIIVPNSSYSPTVLTNWSAFHEVSTKPVGSEIYYQLSYDNGTNWYYWNGSNWVVASVNDYNIASVINANISLFPTTNDQILFRAILESNGASKSQLDEVRIEYNGSPSTANCVWDWDFSTSGDYTYNSTLIDVDNSKADLTNFIYSITDDTQVEFNTGVYSSTLWSTDHLELSPGSVPYSISGDFTSKIYDGGGVIDWQNISWIENLPGPINWFNSLWDKRQQVIIDNSTNAKALVNYQIKLKVPYDLDMNADFSDLRFTQADGITDIDYWIHEYTPSSEAIIWVEVPSIPALSTANIYMYYGNSSAVTTSNGENTFLFFDDFNDGVIDTVKWTEIDTPDDISESGGTLNFTRLSNGGWNQAIISNTTFVRDDLSFDFDYEWIANNAGYDAIMFGWHDSGSGASYANMPYAFYNSGSGGGTSVGMSVYEDGSSPVGEIGVWDLNQDYDVQMRMISGGGNYYEYSKDGGDNWLSSYTSSYSIENNLKIAWSFYSGTHEYDNARVRNWTSPEPITIYASEESKAPTDIQFQVRSCNDSACDTEVFVGPDGTAGTYFTIASGEDIDVQDNRYFQYKVYLTSVNTNLTPELTQVNIVTSGYFSDSKPNIRPIASYSGQPIVEWVNFLETATKPVNTDIYYQLSDDNGATWEWWNGLEWSNVDYGVLTDSNTIALWHFNNSTGLVMDSSDNDHNAINNGAIRGVSGYFNDSVYFDGINDYIEVPHSSSFNFFDTDFTIEFYLKTIDTDGLILKKYTGTFGSDAWGVRLNAGILEFYDGNHWISSGTAVNDDTWKYIVITADNTSNIISFYVNDNLVKTDSFANIIPNIYPLYIGKEVNDGFFAGSIDELRLSNKVRTFQDRYDYQWLFNPASEVNANLGAFNVATDQFMFKAFLESDGKSNLELDNLRLSCIYAINEEPVVTSPIIVAQSTDGTGFIPFNITVEDADNEDTRIKVEYSTDNGVNWYDAEVSSVTVSSGSVDVDNSNTYQIGSVDLIDTNSGSVDLTIIWDTQSFANGNGSLNNLESSSLQVRVTANDMISNGSAGISSSFSVDNLDPSVLNNFILASTSSDTLSVNWTPVVTESHFNHYEIWYGTNQAMVENRTSSKWNDSNDIQMSIITTSSTNITGLSGGITYFMKIWAIDDFGNEVEGDLISAITDPAPVTTYTPATTGGSSGGGGGYRSGYSPWNIKNSSISSDVNSGKDNDIDSGLKGSADEILICEHKNESIIPFIDIENHWAKEYISYLYNNCIIDGSTDNIFHPDSPITRAEAIKIALKSFEPDVINAKYSAKEVVFLDVHPQDWFYLFVNFAYKLNYIDGYEIGLSMPEFRPNESLLRSEALKMLINVSGLKLQKSSDNYFSDISESDWFYDYVNYAYKKNIINGERINNNEILFNPNELITRAEFAKINVLIMKIGSL